MRVPPEKCPFCGSQDVDVDREMETISCRSCGNAAGGANFWEPMERENGLRVIRSGR